MSRPQDPPPAPLGRSSVRDQLWQRFTGVKLKELQAAAEVHRDCQIEGPRLDERYRKWVRVLHGRVDRWLPSSPWVTVAGLLLGGALLEGSRFGSSYSTGAGMAVPAEPIVVLYILGLITMALAVGVLRDLARASLLRRAMVPLAVAVLIDGLVLPTTVVYDGRSLAQVIALGAAGVAYAATMTWLAVAIITVVRRRDPDLDRLVGPLVAIGCADMLWAVSELLTGAYTALAASLLSALAVLVLSVVAFGVVVTEPSDGDDAFHDEDMRPREPEPM